MTLGGRLKSDQYISGTMADILSNLYLAHSVCWYEKHHSISPRLKEFAIRRLCNENRLLINQVIANSPVFKILLLPLMQSSKTESFKDREMVMKELMTNKTLLESIKEDVSIIGSPLENLEKLGQLDPKSKHITNCIIR